MLNRSTAPSLSDAQASDSPAQMSDQAAALMDSLHKEARRLQATSLRSLLDAQPERLAMLCKRAGPLEADFSKQRLDLRALEQLSAWALARGFDAQRSALRQGQIVNPTEGKPALHTRLRDLGSDEPMTQALQAQTARMLHLADQLRQGQWPGLRGQPVNSLICLGIGGSDLGPRLVYDALHGHDDFQVRFVANVDPDELDRALIGLDPTRTAVAIISKTFTTRETLANAEAVRAWLGATGQDEAAIARVLIGVTASPDQALVWGIRPEQLLTFHAAIGGRFSLWSSVGIGIAAGCGSAVFKDLLEGAATLDRHFYDTPIQDNLPALLGLISVWNRAFLGYPTQAIVPYAQRLQLFPSWLQQLVMESNGKSVGLDGQPCRLPTAPVVWGGAGTNAQHAFFQQLHQGPDVVPIDFIVARTARTAPAFPGDPRHRILLANCLAQSAALAFGHDTPPLDLHRALPGERPSTLITVPQLHAQALGALLACYEHATFTAAVVLGINPFDQFGVEYGKVMATAVEHALAGAAAPNLDPATLALTRRLA